MGRLKKMSTSKDFEQFKDCLVKVVFQDGDNIIAKRGRLAAVSDDFIEIHTLENVILIRISEILKIQRSLTPGDTRE